MKILYFNVFYFTSTMMRHLIICFYLVVVDAIGLLSQGGAPAVIGVPSCPPPWDAPPIDDEKPPPYPYSGNVEVILNQAQLYDVPDDQETSKCNNPFAECNIIRMLVFWVFIAGCGAIYYSILRILMIFDLI